MWIVSSSGSQAIAAPVSETRVREFVRGLLRWIWNSLSFPLELARVIHQAHHIVCPTMATVETHSVVISILGVLDSSSLDAGDVLHVAGFGVVDSLLNLVLPPQPTRFFASFLDSGLSQTLVRSCVRS